MKKLILCLILTLGLALMSSASAWAVITPISPGSAGEPNLYSTGGLLDTLYGWTNLTRIDDDHDQLWFVSGAGAYVHPAAKYANYSQGLSAGSVSLFTVPAGGSGILPTGSAYYKYFSVAGMFPFINDPQGGAPPPGFSSIPSANPLWSTAPAGLDRMVTYRLVSGAYAGDFVMCWEDGTDTDYNDMVYRLHSVHPNVPEPSSMILLGIGLLGFGGRFRKRFKA